LGAVYDFEIGGFGERANLRGREFAVEDDEVCAEAQGAHDQFVDLAAPQERARVNVGAPLDDVVEHHEIGGGGEFAQFGHGFFGIGTRTRGDADEDRTVAAFGATRRAAIARHFVFERVDEIEKINVELRRNLRVEKDVRIAEVAVFVFGDGGRQKMRGAHEAGQTRARLDIYDRHQIETKQSQIGQVVLRQLFAAQVRVDAAQAAKTVCGDARAAQVGQFDALGIADDDRLDVALAINERADLPAGLKREFGNLAGKFRRHDLLRRDATRVEFFDAPELIGFESLCVAVNGADVCCPLLVYRPRAFSRLRQATSAARTNWRGGGGWKLEREGCERYDSDAVRSLVMLPCENTSLGHFKPRGR
jgi:hypothetical protein